VSQSSATATCTTASGKSLDELGRLIALRAQRLHELTQDAVIAAAIDVLISLRADTIDARDDKGHSIPRRITPRHDLCVSFRGGDAHTPCLRIGSHNGPRFAGPGSLHFAQRGQNVDDLDVFQIQPRHESIKTYFVAATSVSEALKFEGRQARRRIESKGGLAKTALGIAMAKLSTRNVGDNPTRHARIIASKLSHVTVSGATATGNSGDFALEYRDELNYAVAALKSGDGAMDIAMQKAANKIAGMITHAAHQAGDFEHDVTTPFPDITTRRR